MCPRKPSVHEKKLPAFFFYYIKGDQLEGAGYRVDSGTIMYNHEIAAI